MNITTVFWGIGSSIIGDDGAGPAIAEKLKELDMPWLTAFNCETVPENYLSPLKRTSPSVLVAADAAEMKLRPGEFRRMSLREFANVSFTTHGLPLELLLADFENEISIITIGIQPLRREPSENLSKPVREAVNKITALIAAGEWDKIPPIHQENLSPR
jgi:hydrogenase 3 maturation protease